jgi:ribosomal protein L12E/L44/L45/RPP1/RPP2
MATKAQLIKAFAQAANVTLAQAKKVTKGFKNADIEEAIAGLVGGSVAAQIAQVQQAQAPKPKRRKKRKTKSFAARTRAANQRKTKKRQGQIGGMTKAQLIAQVQRAKPGTYSASALRGKNKTALLGILRRAHSQSLPSQRKSRSSAKLSKTKTKRAAKIAAAVRAGRIPARQGKVAYGDYATGTKRQKLDRYLALYAGVTIRRRSAKAKSKSMKAVYSQMQGPKQPYALGRGYTVQVGGGARGPGIVRKLTKQAKPFRELSQAQQQAVTQFLNSQKGKKLRGKGAKETFSLQAYRDLAKAKKLSKSRKTSRGAANWW